MSVNYLSVLLPAKDSPVRIDQYSATQKGFETFNPKFFLPEKLTQKGKSRNAT